MADEEQPAENQGAVPAEIEKAEDKPVRKPNVERLVKMLEEGYEVVVTVNVRGRGVSRYFNVPKKYHDLFKRAYVMKKDGKYCMLTEDEERE
jgi:hypothetical protein